MSAGRLRCSGVFPLILWLSGVVLLAAQAQDKPADKPAPEKKFPSGEEVAALLQNEPMTLENWKEWSKRLQEWINDPGKGTDKAFEVGRDFVFKQLDAKGELPEPLAKDALAWYLLGSRYLVDRTENPEKKERLAALGKSEKALRRSVELSPSFAQARRNLASALLQHYSFGPQPGESDEQADVRLISALNELDEAGRLNSRMPSADIKGLAGHLLFRRSAFPLADRYLLEAFREDPSVTKKYLDETALTVLLNSKRDYPSTLVELKELNAQFPQNGKILSCFGVALFATRDFDGAMNQFTRARELGVEPAGFIPSAALAHAARSVLQSRDIDDQGAAVALRRLVEMFPDDGPLACWFAYGLFMAREPEEAAQELNRARALGAEPGEGFPIWQIEVAAIRKRLERIVAWTTLPSFGVLALLMALMAFAGTKLAGHTPAAILARLVPASAAPPTDKTLRDRPLGRPAGLYVAALCVGAVCFHAAFWLIVFVLLGINAGLLYLLLIAPDIQVRLLLALVIALCVAWAILDHLFTREQDERFGMPFDAKKDPRLSELIGKVAKQVEADLPDQVCLAPGAIVALQKRNRGPFAVFGVRRRVLTLGYAALNFLTVGELEALLVGEFVQESRRDGRASRWVNCATRRLEDTFAWLWEHSGNVNTINLIFGFLWLYYRAYALLAAGFCQTRVLLGDRLAAGWYGSDVVSSGLTKVGVDADVFEDKLLGLAREILAEEPLDNMFAAFRDVCYDDPHPHPHPPPKGEGEGGGGEAVQTPATRRLVRFDNDELKPQERESRHKKRLATRSKPGSTEPTLGERLEAVAALPKATEPNKAPALELFDNLDELERQLTAFATPALKPEKPKPARGK